VDITALVLGVGWIGFWIYWIVASVGAKRSDRSRWARFAGLRILIIILVVFLLRLKHLNFGGAVTQDPLRQSVGLAIFVLGLGLAIWARIYIGRDWGMPMSVKTDPELVTTGPYRTIRHPIYTGIILAMIGTAIALTWYWFVVAGATSGYFIYSAFMEERYLAERFPDAYPEYKRSTKMLIPFIF
jgi:protein-S-isoprenylcysteine O-methyltransferase Ste14